MSYSVIIFGASGAIGQALCNWHIARGCTVTGVARTLPTEGNGRIRWISWDPGMGADIANSLNTVRYDAAIWAQGMNAADNIRSFDRNVHLKVYEANVVYVMISLKQLLDTNILADKARLVVISSIWQDIARPNKLSYCVSKSALIGLVRSAALDLGTEGKLINAVLPGALDTPMTRANLTPEQIGKLEGMTPLGSLPALDDVCNLVGYLGSPDNTGITGQFIAADRGFSHAKIL